MQEIWCKTARLQYTISKTVMSTHLMLSNFGVNRTAGDISNALSECEMQAKEQMLPFVSIQLDMNRIFFFKCGFRGKIRCFSSTCRTCVRESGSLELG